MASAVAGGISGLASSQTVPMLPTVRQFLGNGVDPTFEIASARLGPPKLMQGINPDSAYPLPSFAPAGTASEDLNNVHTFLNRDMTHPSPAGVGDVAARTARSVFDAIMAL